MWFRQTSYACRGEMPGAGRSGQPMLSTGRVTTVWRVALALGVGILTCIGLMTVLAATYSPTDAAQPRQHPQHLGGASQSFSVTVFTSDRQFTVTLDVNPNRSGTNVFTVSVVDTGTGTSITNVGVSLSTTMLDMKMGTDTIHLHPDGKGHFSAHRDLAMGGDWRIRIQIRTPDQRLHEATVNVLTPG